MAPALLMKMMARAPWYALQLKPGKMELVHGITAVPVLVDTLAVQEPSPLSQTEMTSFTLPHAVQINPQRVKAS